MNHITVNDVVQKKGKEKITMLTCYDYSFAHILDDSAVDIILVGDSLANVVLGMDETRKVSLTEMVNHTKAVVQGAVKSLVVADMPYISFQKGIKKCVCDAKKFIMTGAGAVKIEWFKNCQRFIKNVIKNKIPVMGHIGLTPQTAHLLGGYKVQGKDKESALRLIEQAKVLEDLGVFSIVLECIPYQVSKLITKSLKIPTIGIGAGKFCDGQVLVLYDLLGLYQKKQLKFVRVYKNLHLDVKSAVLKFISDVRSTQYPTEQESFSLKKSEWQQISNSI